MEWDEMQVLALKADNAGLRCECHDPDCKRAVWREFWDFPPTMTLRELRSKVRCDTCGSLRGYPVNVWPVSVGSHDLDKSLSMAQHRDFTREQDLRLLIPYPYGQPKVLNALPRRPSPELVDLAHVTLGVSIFDRYALTTAPAVLRSMFCVERWPGNGPPVPAVVPDDEALIVRVAATGARELVTARWGWKRGRRGWVANARNLESREWRGILGDVGRRCLIPASAFAAPHPIEHDQWGRRRTVWFRYEPKQAQERGSWTEVNRPPFAFAGFYKRWDWKAEGLRREEDRDDAQAGRALIAYVIVTTEPTSTVHPIQPKAMPLVLREGQWEDWLKGNAVEALSLQRRLDDDVVSIAWTGADEDLAANAAETRK
jgi:putative SOS response-associated peptidase YedK